MTIDKSVLAQAAMEDTGVAHLTPAQAWAADHHLNDPRDAARRV